MHWSYKYVSTPYSKLNCAELVEKVQKKEFNREFKFPQSEGNFFAESKQIKKEFSNYVFPERTMNFSEGDLVLMHGERRMAHVGVFCIINSKPYCLHSLKKAGCVCLHRIRDLGENGLFLEGIYKWRKLDTTKTL